MKKILDAVKSELPKFNDDILVDLSKRELDEALPFIVERLEEALEVINEDVHLENVSIVPPYERAKFDMDNSTTKGARAVSIDQNEVMLVNFDFRIGQHTFSKRMYIPYRFENQWTVINGTKYVFQLCLVEKLFSRINNGITIKVIRSPIKFWKNKLYSVTSLTSGNSYTETAIEAKIHLKKSSNTRNRLKPTLVHHLLCKFGFIGTMEKLGIPTDSCEFVREIGDKEFEYFKAQNISPKNHPILLKVHPDVMKNNAAKRFIIAILYIVNGFKKIDFDDLVNDSITVFRVMLGRIIFSKETKVVSAYNYMTDHINSFDTYLDSIVKELFHQEGIMVEDIYDVLVYVFYNIDRILLEYSNNNLYNKKFTSFFLPLVNSFTVPINKSIYDNEKDKNKKQLEDVVEKMLSIFPRRIVRKLYSETNTRMNPNSYNDNELLTLTMKIIKKLGITKANSSKAINAPVNKFHPSFVAVESLVGFSSSNPSTNAVINPYVRINENGGIIRDDRCDKIDTLKQYF